MKEDRNTPSLRFKGFEGKWEEKRFSELYEKRNEKNDLTYGPEKIISVANMYYKPDAYITDPNYLLTYNVFELGDIAFEGNKSKSYAHGRFVENTIGNGIVSHVFDVFRPIMSPYDLFFWKYAINNESLMGKILIRCTKSSIMMNNLVAQDFLEESFLVPSIQEQEQIGAFLNSLDRLLSLQEQKLEKLQSFKKAMLDKMFPQRGSRVPEIRFQGFTEPWEEVVLSKLVSQVTRNDPSSEAPIMMITANDGFIDQSERYNFNNAGESLKKYILLKKGELAYNHGASKLRPYGSCFALTNKDYARIPFVYHCFSTDTQNPEFLSFVLNEQSVMSQLRKIISSGARMDGLLNISFDEYTSLSISIPTKEEQDQIVLYFSHLDRLLSLHRQKLEKLQSLKKAMLDQMFPSTSKARESEGSEKNKEPEEAASITPYDTKAPTR